MIGRRRARIRRARRSSLSYDKNDAIAATVWRLGFKRFLPRSPRKCMAFGVYRIRRVPHYGTLLGERRRIHSLWMKSISMDLLSG